MGWGEERRVPTRKEKTIKSCRSRPPFFLLFKGASFTLSSSFFFFSLFECAPPKAVVRRRKTA